MSLTDIRIENDLGVLLNLIRSRSRFFACRATTAWLATELGWSEDRVDDRLSRLEERGSVWRSTTPPQHSGSTWTRGRTIYLRSSSTPVEGALMVANLCRYWGRKVRLRREAACGQLRCMPSELDEWLRLAQAEGFVKVSRADDGIEFVERIGNFQAVALPNRYCEDHWNRPEAAATLAENVLAFVRSRTQASPPHPPTHTEVAAHVRGSRSHVNEAIRALVNAGELFPYQRGRRHHVASDRGTAEAEAARPDDPIAWALIALRQGPMTTRELALHLRLEMEKPLPARLRKRLHAHGVEMTKLGRQYVASLGPLPEQYRLHRTQEQKVRKAGNDRARRRRLKLGLQHGDEYLLLDVRMALQKLLVRVWETRFAWLQLDHLRREADEFAKGISEEVLAGHVRAARADAATGEVYADRIAAQVLADVRDEFAVRAARLQRELRRRLTG